MSRQKEIFNELLHSILGSIRQAKVSKGTDGEFIISEREPRRYALIVISESTVMFTRMSIITNESSRKFYDFEDLNIEEITKSFIDFTNQ